MSPPSRLISRRNLLGSGALGAGSLLVAGCDRMNASPTVRGVLAAADGLHESLQRLIIPRDALAQEFSPVDMSPVFRSNGNTDANDNADWAKALDDGFTQWTLAVDGLVKRPLALPLTALKAMAQRTQITRHDCVEGWSAIGQWQGPQLGQVLAMAGLLPAARFVVFHCADSFGGAPYYESIDLIDGFHPQTILAHSMNGKPLAIEHGAPLRLRVERQLGYKQAKYIMRIELRATLAGLYGGGGGFWEDASGYQWYAGI